MLLGCRRPKVTGSEQAAFLKQERDRGIEMLKTISAMLAAALIMVPGLSPSVSASTATHKSDRLDLTLRMANCRQMAWPYYDQSCRKDAGRPARLVTTDRM
jgi:hypothetical protein